MTLSRTLALMAVALAASAASAQLAVKAARLHTMGPAGTIENGVVVVGKDGKIAAVGPAATTAIPEGYKLIEAAVVTPGLIDARCTVGVSGLYNTRHDSDQLERSNPIQPEMRAIDAYNPKDKLVEFVRSFGVTALHTGHAPGELVSGQTFLVKTDGPTADAAMVLPVAAISATIGPGATKGGDKSPGTRAKSIAMLRAELIRAQEYDQKVNTAPPDKRPDRNLRLETLARAIRGEVPLLVTAHRGHDIDAALRLQDEFKFNMILDGASEVLPRAERLVKLNVPVIIHPSMMRFVGEAENASFETAAKLRAAGVRVALQGGYESYVPKARVVLFEAGLCAANGMTFEQALATITIDAARILGADDRLGSIEVGKDGDIAAYDGDPFEYTTHCTATIVSGRPAFEGRR